ncbi:MAG: DUF3991 domain-containing protein [Cyanobacteria bacterium WB6_1B_304]|nr:DUF3991 domain-containing protein [Cyanobacteria bacterium WB6_1B_304]
MKAKISRGHSFKGAVNYILDLGKKDTHTKEPEIISSNMSAQYMQDFTKEFVYISNIREDIKKPVWHCSLTLPVNEKLSKENWEKVSNSFLKRMEVDTNNHQYICVRHHDTEHDHVHILVNRVGLDSTIWFGRHELPKAIEATQKIEKEFNLSPTKGYTEKSEIKKLSDKEINMAIRTGDEPPRQYLQNTIDEILKQKSISAPEFAKRLEDFGINVRANLANTGKMNGFSFEYNNISFKGQDLGQKYKWSELQKRGVSYEQTRDCEKLKCYTKDFEERKFIAGSDRDITNGTGKISRESERGTERNHFTTSEFEGRSEENFRSLQQSERESEKHITGIIQGNDKSIIKNDERKINGSEKHSDEFKQHFNSFEKNNWGDRRAETEILQDTRGYERNNGKDEEHIGRSDQQCLGNADILEKNNISNSISSSGISNHSNSFTRVLKETIRYGSSFETVSTARNNSKESNEKRNVVDKSNIRTSRELDPSDCLRTMGFEVKKDGQNHLSVELNGDQIYRITKKQDGHYVACDKYGNGIGDNIALIQDIKPDLKFDEAVYKLHAYDLNYKFENKNMTQEIDKKIDLKIPRQVENERKLGRQYLHEKRGISFDTINHAEKVGLIKYSDKGVLFIGYDENQNVKNVTQRSIKESNAIQKMDYKGSDKQYCQILDGNKKSIWIVEGGIDALALRDLALRQKQDPPTILISGGANVKSFLERDSIQNLLKDASRVTIAVENERNVQAQNRSDQGHERQSEKIREIVGEQKEVRSWSHPSFKDVAEMNLHVVLEKGQLKAEQEREQKREQEQLKVKEKRMEISRGFGMGR